MPCMNYCVTATVDLHCIKVVCFNISKAIPKKNLSLFSRPEYRIGFKYYEKKKCWILTAIFC